MRTSVSVYTHLCEGTCVSPCTQNTWPGLSWEDRGCVLCTSVKGVCVKGWVLKSTWVIYMHTYAGLYPQDAG